jgi:hypothetical protein
MKRLAKNIISLIAGIVLLLAFSMIPIDIHNFAFPTNLFLLLGLIYFSLLAGRLSERFRFLSSRKAALLSTIAVILLMIIHWLFYHRQIFIGSKLPIVLYDFSSSALFIFTWMFFLLVLGAVIARRLTIVKENNISFLLNHIGLWITLSVGFFWTSRQLYITNNFGSKQYDIAGYYKRRTINGIAFLYRITRYLL